MVICGLCKRAWRQFTWTVVSVALFAFVGGFIVAWGLRDYQSMVYRNLVKKQFTAAVVELGRYVDNELKKDQFKRKNRNVVHRVNR